MRTTEGRRGRLILCILAAALLSLFLLSFWLGRYDVPPGEVVRILLARLFPLDATWTEQMQVAVVHIRLPRICLPAWWADAWPPPAPPIRAYSAIPWQRPTSWAPPPGPASGPRWLSCWAFPAAASRSWPLAAACCPWRWCMPLPGAPGNQVMSILLAGVMIGSLFSACTSYVKLVADPSNQLPEITYWLMGSLSGSRLKDVSFAVIPMLIGLVPLYILRWRINLLTLDEEEARSMGVHTRRLRLTVILCATVLTAVSVAVSGMIGWVGLVIPHLSRKLVGNDCRYLLPVSTIFGAIFLLLVDTVSRNLLAVEIPIGILTAFVGAPFFLYLMTRKEHSL